MYGGIPASVLLDYAKSIGIYSQPPLDGLHTPPWFFIEPEYLCSVVNKISYYSPDGKPYGTHGTVDHPSFTRLREHLVGEGLISVERGWINGDRVLKSFYLNNYLMLPGDKFLSASAMWHYMERNGNYNNGQIDPTVKNYRND